jgi:ribosomal protein S14
MSKSRKKNVQNAQKPAAAKKRKSKRCNVCTNKKAIIA